MILYTNQPPEAVFEAAPTEDERKTEYHMVGGLLCECMKKPDGSGSYMVERLLTTNPFDYLNPAFAPGAELYPPFSDEEEMSGV